MINAIEIFNTLRYQPESEVVEFKKAEFNFDSDDLGKYFSALSNEANIHNKEFAWLAFGVHDKSREIIGTRYRDSEKVLHKLKHELAQNITGGLTFREIYELKVDEKRVVLFQIPAAPQGMPIAWKGHWYGRNGESLKALDLNKLDEIRKQNLKLDWSAAVIPDASINDLDSKAILKAREQFKIRHSYRSVEVDSWDDYTFLNKAKFTIKGQVTRTAIIILGKEESEHYLNPSVAKIRWSLKTLNNENKDYDIFSIPMIITVDNLYNKVRNIKYRFVREGTIFPDEMLRYDPFNIREPLNNAIAHQDYTRCAMINVVEFEDDRLVFENMGYFIPDSIEAVVDNDSPEIYYRNRFLVDAMRNVNMIETERGGIKKMFKNQRVRFFPLPEYKLTSDKVKVEIIGKVVDENFARILMNNSALSLSEVILLDKVQKKKILEKEEIDFLRKLKLIEGRAPNIYLSFEVVQPTEDKQLKAQYIKNKSFDDKHFKEMIIEYLRTYEMGSKADFIGLLVDKLSDSLSPEQKVKKVTNLLSSLKNEGYIKNLGYSKWGLN